MATAKKAPRRKSAPTSVSVMTPSLEARQAKVAELEKAIAEERASIAAERDGHIKRLWEDFTARLSSVGATVEDAHRVGRYKPPRPKVLSAKDTNGSGSTDGAKVRPKYRNPATGEMWSGRGLNPRWMKEAIAKGKKKDDFLIK